MSDEQVSSKVKKVSKRKTKKDEVAELKAEIVSLKSEIERLHSTSDFAGEIASLKAEIEHLKLTNEVSQSVTAWMHIKAKLDTYKEVAKMLAKTLEKLVSPAVIQRTKALAEYNAVVKENEGNEQN